MISLENNYEWLFYKNETLIEEYKNLKIINNRYIVNDNLSLLKSANEIYLERKDEEYKIKIDFVNNFCFIHMNKENMDLKIPLLETEIVDKEDKITIIYKLDEEETNKLIINLKE